MTRTEAMADIAKRFPAIPRSQAEKHWRKSDAFLRMLASKYSPQTGYCQSDADGALVAKPQMTQPRRSDLAGGFHE